MTIPRPLIADNAGRIFELPFYGALGMKADQFVSLDKNDLIPLPYASRLMILPERIPVVYDYEQGRCVFLAANPFDKKPCFAVGAFIAPGWTVTHNAAFARKKNSVQLPLYAYAAVVWYKGGFYASAVRVERERRQDVRLMNSRKVRRNVPLYKKKMPRNRLVRHLQHCALDYGCPAAQNFFLGRYEAPLPTSSICNARCWGCLSLQPSGCCPSTQPRIQFTPTPEEVAEVALHHLYTGRRRVVSFGQGCEGEPLCRGDLLLKAITLIRAQTKRGTINLNTNASKPQVIKQLCQAGLDSIRVSLNSVRSAYYMGYFRPQRYSFQDVIKSITVAKRFGKFVSLNYFVQPGFTDSSEEVSALMRFLKRYQIDLIQWRNLNYDPHAYFDVLFAGKNRPRQLKGVKNVIQMVADNFPRIMHGYFNPPKEKFSSSLVKIRR